MKNKTLYRLRLSTFVCLTLIIGCQSLKNTSDAEPPLPTEEDTWLPPNEPGFQKHSNMDSTNLYSNEFEDLEPMDPGRDQADGELDSNEYGPGYWGRHVGTDSSKKLIPRVINMPRALYELNQDSSFWSYYNNCPYFTQKDKDSLKHWIERFRPIDEEREIKQLIKVAGDRFYTLPDSELYERIIYWTSTGIADSLCKFTYWEQALQNYSLYRGTFIDSIEGPLEQIWQENNLFFIRVPYYSYKFNNKKQQEIFNEIKKLRGGYDSITGFMHLKNPEQISKINGLIEQLSSDNEKCKMYFILWHTLYSYNYIEKDWEITNRIFSIANSSKQITTIDRTTWIVAIAKITASIDFYKYSNKVFELLKSVQYYLKDRNSQGEFEKAYKIELLRALYWSTLPGYYGKRNAIELCADEFKRSYEKLTEDEISKFYSYMTYFWAVYIANKLSDSYYRWPLDRELLWCSNNLINIKAEANSFNESENRALIALANFYLLKGSQESLLISKRYSYLLLSRVLHDPKSNNSLANLHNVIGLIQHINVELRDSSEFSAWNTLIPYGKGVPIPLSSNTDSWDEAAKYQFTDYMLNSPIDSAIKYNDKHWLRKTLIKEFPYLTKEQTTVLKAKADSIYPDNYEELYFMAGVSGSAGFNYSHINLLNRNIDDLKLQKNGLQASVAVYKDSINDAKLILEQKNDSIRDQEYRLYVLDTTIKGKERKIGTLEELNLKLNEANQEVTNLNLQLWGAVVLLVLLAACIAYLRRSAVLKAKFNKYKANIWQELGHIPGKSIDTLYERLLERLEKKEAVVKSDLDILFNLKDLINGLFKNIVKPDTKMGNRLSSELKLAKIYVDYKNRVTPASIQFTWSGQSDIIVPPAILISCTRNAIEHGELLDENEGKIHLEVQSGKKNVIRIMNNGKPFDPGITSLKKLKKSSTGFRNISDILDYFNKKKWLSKRMLDWGNISHPIFKCETILKMKNYGA